MEMEQKTMWLTLQYAGKYLPEDIILMSSDDKAPGINICTNPVIKMTAWQQEGVWVI